MWSVPELIRKKRDGHELGSEEVRWLINGFVRGEVPDYQMSALLMAVYFQGLSPRETLDLTMAMVDSGQRVDLSTIPGLKADKHSTGGVGDKTTLVLAPLVAAAGLPVAKLSGRGLGHTGGTLDKLESIPGFNVNLAIDQLISQVQTIGLAIGGQTAELVPADGRLYALRDVTATVESIPLIASSVMSKKIAGGADVIVLDVKVGRGAFMKDLVSAKSLAEAMVAIGQAAGRRVGAVLSSMNQPLGNAVGNALEVLEAIDTLNGGGPTDLRTLCLELGARLLVLAGLCEHMAAGRSRLAALLDGGAARERFARLIQAQGGDHRVLDDPGLLPAAPVVLPVSAPRTGYICGIDALAIGLAAMRLGAGRQRKGEPVDHAAGVVLRKKVSDAVSAGEALAEVHARDKIQAEAAVDMVRDAFEICPEQPAPPPLILYHI